MPTMLHAHLLAAFLAGAAFGGPPPDTVFYAGFGPGWEDRWHLERLDGRVPAFRVEQEDGDPILRADSDAAAAALWQPLDVEARGLSFAWRWRIEAALVDNRRERERAGDDYAARVFIIFDAAPFSPDARAVCYVWASREAPGSVYPNPYVSGVNTLVLRSGDDQAGAWMTEERDVAADYELAFAEPPGRVSGVAVMVDTDDTGVRATAWFDDIRLIESNGAR